MNKFIKPYIIAALISIIIFIYSSFEVAAYVFIVLSSIPIILKELNDNLTKKALGLFIFVLINSGVILIVHGINRELYSYLLACLALILNHFIWRKKR